MAQLRRGVVHVAKLHIDFMGHRKAMLGFSLVLVLISIGSLAIKGLTFGVEFQGGTSISVTNSGAITTEQVTDAFEEAGMDVPSVQTSEGQGGTKGFIIRSEETEPDTANRQVADVAAALKLPVASFRVTTIGPGWGKNITDRAVLALLLSLAAIFLYVTVRFDYKMSITALVAVAHDLLITLGIYSLLGAEVTPNTIAALLTILGYSLYDTVIVFSRMKENSQHLVKQTFMSMVNESINEIFVRTLNTGITSLLPVFALLFFGGDTLFDFALALTIGQTVGLYSSYGVASPLYAMWKEAEPKYAALRKKYASA